MPPLVAFVAWRDPIAVPSASEEEPIPVLAVAISSPLVTTLIEPELRALVMEPLAVSVTVPETVSIDPTAIPPALPEAVESVKLPGEETPPPHWRS